MDAIKISLWLLAMISVYKSECKSFRKYVPNTRNTNNEKDDNCFCFKNPGDHHKVPEILNQTNDNLIERLIIYLYKDKSTGQVKMYMPNEEKQALIPDLAFEVGDKLVTVDDEKIIDIFPHSVNTAVDQQPHIDTNKILPTDINKQNEFPYDDYVDRAEPQVNRVVSQEKDRLHIYDINSDEHTVDSELAHAEKFNKPTDVIYDILNKQPQGDTNRVPSKSIDIPPEVINGGHDNSEDSFEKVIPSKTNNNDFIAPGSDWNILPEYTNHKQHELPIYFNILPTKQINVPGEVVYHDNVNYVQYEDPYISTNGVLEPSNEPGKAINHNKVNSNVRYYQAHVDDSSVSKQINVPGQVMYPYNINYYGPDEQTHVENISVLEQLNVPGKAIHPDNVDFHVPYKQPHVDANDVSKQINIPGEVIYPNKIYFHGHHENPYIDDKVPKQINVPFKVNYPDNVNYHAQHKHPHIDTNGNSKQANVPGRDKYPDHNYYNVQHQPLIHTNDVTEHINVQGENIYEYDPLVYFEQGTPSKSSKHTVMVDDKPHGNWNIPSEWAYEHTIDPTDDMLLKSSEESKEIELSEKHNSNEAIVENGSYQKEDSSVEYIKKGNNFIEHSQLNKSEYSNETKMIDSSEENKYSDELDAIIKSTKKDKTKSPNYTHNQYETFDRWFIQQMQRFQTYTEHDKAINIETIERYILNILENNGMHVTIEGVLTDSFGTALDIHKLHLRPILIGNSLAVENILIEKTTDLVMPANMVYLQAILVTNANPSMILGMIPIGKTVIPPSSRNVFSKILKPHVNYDSSIALSKHPTLPSTYQTQFPLGEPVSLDVGRQFHHKSSSVNFKELTKPEKNNLLGLQLDSTKHLPDNSSKKSGHSDGKTVFNLVQKTPVEVHHRHRQPVKSVKIYGTGDKEVSFLSENSEESVNKFVNSLSGPESLLSSADATNKLLAALRSDGSLFKSSEEINESDVDEDFIAERIVGGSAATGSGAPLSMKGRMKDN